jgi:hypothetical protein
LARGNGAASVRKHGDRLRPAAEAKTVSVREGKLLVRDGPFADAKDEISGYDIIECADFNEAIEIASKHATAKFGMIEIRSVWQARRFYSLAVTGLKNSSFPKCTMTDRRPRLFSAEATRSLL